MTSGIWGNESCKRQGSACGNEADIGIAASYPRPLRKTKPVICKAYFDFADTITKYRKSKILFWTFDDYTSEYRYPTFQSLLDAVNAFVDERNVRVISINDTIRTGVLPRYGGTGNDGRCGGLEVFYEEYK